MVFVICDEANWFLFIIRVELCICWTSRGIYSNLRNNSCVHLTVGDCNFLYLDSCIPAWICRSVFMHVDRGVPRGICERFQLVLSTNLIIPDKAFSLFLEVVIRKFARLKVKNCHHRQLVNGWNVKNFQILFKEPTTIFQNGRCYTSPPPPPQTHSHTNLDFYVSACQVLLQFTFSLLEKRETGVFRGNSFIVLVYIIGTFIKRFSSKCQNVQSFLK